MMFHSVGIILPGPLRETVDHPLLGPLLVAALKVRDMVRATGDESVYDPGEIIIAHVPIEGNGVALQVRANIRAPSFELAEKGARLLFEVAEKSALETFVRAPPQAASERDFERDEVIHKSHVRFVVMNHAGPVRHREPHEDIVRFVPQAAAR